MLIDEDHQRLQATFNQLGYEMNKLIKEKEYLLRQLRKKRAENKPRNLRKKCGEKNK